jgi:Putative DNA-binding domain
MMLAKPLTEIQAADLFVLVEQGISESVTLEFKAELPEGGDGASVKILREIAALANTAGGDLLFGIAEEDSVASSLQGLEKGKEGLAIQRLENLCRSGLDPQLTGVQFRSVEISADRYVLVVRVPKSWASPHRVTAGGHAHFYGRNSKESYPLGVHALRSAFGQSESVLQRINSFRLDRVAKLQVGDSPVTLADGAIMVLHVAPLSTFSPESSNNLWPSQSDRHDQFGPLGGGGGCMDVNFEGFVIFGSRTESSHSYCQVSRSGWVESACALQPWGQDDDPRELMIAAPWFEKAVVEAAQQLTSALLANGIAGPYWFGLSFMRAKGYRLFLDGLSSRQPTPLSDDVLVCPGTIAASGELDPMILWRTTFDRVYNAFGLERSRFFDR